MNKEILTELFSTDPDLLSKYHIIAPNSAEACAEKTLNDLADCNVEVHLIKENDEIIGYYGLENKDGMGSLTGFFLKPEYRTKEHITKFWKEVDSHFDKDYFIGVFARNTRVIEFLKKKTTMKYEIDNVVLFRVGR